MLDNVLEFPVVWLALARLGAAIVPLNVRYRSVDAQHVLDDAGVRLVVTSPAYADLLRGLSPAPEVVLVEDLLAADRRARRSSVPSTPTRSSTCSTPPARPDGPKGCLLSHRYWTTLGRQPGRGVPAHRRGRRDAHRAAVLLPRPDVERRDRADGRRPPGGARRLPPVDLLGPGASSRRHLLLLPRRDADAAAEDARRPARPRPPRARGAVLRDPAGPARRPRGAMGRAVVRGVRDDRDRAPTSGSPPRTTTSWSAPAASAAPPLTARCASTTADSCGCADPA